MAVDFLYGRLRSGLKAGFRSADAAAAASAISAAVLFAVYLVSSSLFLYQYFVKYPEYSALEWNSGFREAISHAAAHADKYSQIVVTKNIPFSYIYVLFYSKYDPAELQKNPLTRDGPYPAGKIGRFVIRDPYLQYSGFPQLFITGYWNVPTSLPSIRPNTRQGFFR